MGRGEEVRRQDWETRQGRDMCVMKAERTLERRGPARRGREDGADRTKYSHIHECRCHTESHYFMCSLKHLILKSPHPSASTFQVPVLKACTTSSRHFALLRR